MIEYIVGNDLPSKYQLTPNSETTSAILFTETYRKMIFHTFYEENTNNVCAVEIDQNILIGTKYGESRELAIEFEESNDHLPSFDSMVFQQVIKQAGDNKSLFWSNITYLELVYKGKKYIMGEEKPIGCVKLEDKQKDQLKYDFLPPIRVSNPFYISGVHIHNAGICAFQIIEFPQGILPEIDHLISYGQSKYAGLSEAKGEDGEFNLTHLTMKHQVVAFENIEPIRLLQLLYERSRGWTSGRSVISTYYPKFIALIDEALIKRDYTTIHSVFRLERYLKSLIIRPITYNKHKKYQEDMGLTTKLYHLWKPLSLSMELCQKIHNRKFELNCYQISYLSNDPVDLLYASITIICQICLILLLGMSLLDMEVGDIFPLYEGMVIIPIIFLFTLFVISKQLTNTLLFYTTFPDCAKTFVGKCDLFSNVLCASVVVLLNFFVLAYSDSLLDIVLNSLAALFIIELDDNMVFISDDMKDDLFRQKIISFLNDQFQKIPDLYFGSHTWKHTGGMYHMIEEHVYVNRESCELCEKKSSPSNSTDPLKVSVHVDHV